MVRSTGFFAEKPIVLDLTRVSLTQLDYIGLMTELEIRKIRIISVEGVDADWRDPNHAPLGNGGRSGNVIEFPEPPGGDPAPDDAGKQSDIDTDKNSDNQTDMSDAPEADGPDSPSQRSGHEAATRQVSTNAVVEETRSRSPGPGAATAAQPNGVESTEDAAAQVMPVRAQPDRKWPVQSGPVKTPQEHPEHQRRGGHQRRTAKVAASERVVDFNRNSDANSLLLEVSVRSGQSVVFPNGDVTVLGSIASGAEVVAGGSIHVYGALRGRAIAGSNGNTNARIFCAKLEAELLAIDGLYKTADDMEPHLRNQPVQAWLEGEVMKLKSQD